MSILVLAALLLSDAWEDLGRAPSGERQAILEMSPQWRDGTFHNRFPLFNDYSGMVVNADDMSAHAAPEETLVFTADVASLARRADFRVTWLGHSILLLDVDGRRFLIDPVWSERVSPFTWMGPKRWYAPPIPLDLLPPIDAVLISHDHYDHLDMLTIKALIGRVQRFVVRSASAHISNTGV